MGTNVAFLTGNGCRAALAAVLVASGAWAQTTTLVSLAASGAPANTYSNRPAISNDGRFVAFDSLASDIVVPDANGKVDVFVRDLLLGTNEVVSLPTSGAPSQGDSRRPALSSDGRFVAFECDAPNFSPQDKNGKTDIYLRDRWTLTTTLVTVSYATGLAVGGQEPAISHDGRWVAFHSNSFEVVPGDTNGYADVFLRDMLMEHTYRVSVNSSGAQASDLSVQPSLSGDGRRVAFHSYSNDLVAGDTGFIDIFVHDLMAGWTLRASVSSSGIAGNDYSIHAAISADGQSVSFTSFATNLVAVDLNGKADVFVHDLDTGLTELVSLATSGQQGNLGSGNVAGGLLDCTAPLSADGQRLAFLSEASTLVPGDTNGKSDLFLRDRTTARTERLSVSSSGLQANNQSPWVSLSGDGLRAGFLSWATSLVSIPGIQSGHIYLRDWNDCSAPLVHCTSKTNSQGCLPAIGWTGVPSIASNPPFRLTATSVINQQVGVFVYGKSGPAALPFQGGWLCSNPPVVRSGSLGSGGDPPPANCSGTFDFDFPAWIASGADPGLVPGAQVDGQVWYRDPPAAFWSGLTNAVGFVLCP